MSEPQWRVFGNTQEIQTPFDVAVVMPTIARPSAIKALRSIYAQTNVGRIQVLIGVDKAKHDLSALIDVLKACPDHITACLFDPGYSTSVRHGGVHLARDGGSLRAVLTLLANTQYVAYLDDDNWWGPKHLADLLTAMKGRDWAFSLRWFVHPQNLRPVCVDEWESVGPGRGIFLNKFDGFVDPNCLMIDKMRVWECVSLWSIPVTNDEKGMSADRNIFNFLKNKSPPGETGQASVFYLMDPNDVMGSRRHQLLGALYDQVGLMSPASTQSTSTY